MKPSKNVNQKKWVYPTFYLFYVYSYNKMKTDIHILNHKRNKLYPECLLSSISTVIFFYLLENWRSIYNSSAGHDAELKWKCQFKIRVDLLLPEYLKDSLSFHIFAEGQTQKS